jgi:acetyl esterase/lipase
LKDKPMNDSIRLKLIAAALLSSSILYTSVAESASDTVEIVTMRNIPYVENGHPNQILDLYLPDQPSNKPLPLMIWIHGGAWMAGSHANPPVLYLVNEGFAVASIQHRFSSHAIWPAQAYDCKAAIRFLRANAVEYNLDPDHFGVGGDSSGGHLAAFIGTSGDVSDMEGDLGNTNASSCVQAVVDWFSPTDFTLMAQQSGPGSIIQHDSPTSPESLLLGGPVQEKLELANTANPLTYIDENDPPFLIMHGDNDQLVPLGQSVILAKALIDAGVEEVTMKTIHGAGHEGPEFHSAESRQLIKEFLSRTLKMAEEETSESTPSGRK